MEQALRERIREAVAKELEDNHRYCKQPDGTFNMEIYADCLDENGMIQHRDCDECGGC